MVKFEFTLSGHNEISETIGKISFHLKEIEKLKKELSKMSLKADVIESKP